MAWNWSLSLITFSMSFPSVYNRKIGWNILGESYKVLLDLRMMIDNDILKCDSKYSKLIHMLAMLTKFFKYILSLTIALRCFQDILSRLGIDKLLYLAMEILNSSLENRAHIIVGLVGILFNILELICWLCTELKDWWRACHRSSSSIYSWLL